MFIKRSIAIGLSLIVVLVGLLAACAAPAPTPTPTLTPSPTPTTTPVSGPLAQIIAGARKEGTVSVILSPSTFTPKSIERLEAEIKQRFGVDLDIIYTPCYMVPDLNKAIMEYQAGAPPSNDTLSGQVNQIVLANEAGVYEQVDWKSLITEDTNPAVVMGNPRLRGAIANYSSARGIFYNPEKIPAPLTMADLANPKYKGRIGLFNIASPHARRAFILGKDKVFAELRAIMMNKPFVGRYIDQLNHYLLGELWISDANAQYYNIALQKGMPAAFQCLDYAEISNFGLVVRKGAAHPNAAKLVLIYLATPAGAKFTLEEGGTGTLYYPGNFEQDVLAQAEKQRLPVYFLETYPGLLDFVLSDETAQLENQINLILRGG